MNDAMENVLLNKPTLEKEKGFNCFLCSNVSFCRWEGYTWCRTHFYDMRKKLWEEEKKTISRVVREYCYEHTRGSKDTLESF